MVVDKYIYISYYLKDDLNYKKFINNLRYIKIKYYDGDTYYIDKYDKYHRTGGPAIIEYKMNYNKTPPERSVVLVYYQHGHKHRLDGPALIEQGNNQYYIDGVKLSKKAYWEIINNRIEKGLL